MTFSILATDPESGRIGGAAATGSLCVGGWVLRADPGAGASASQGAAPSTFWGEDVLRYMREGLSAEAAVRRAVLADTGREARQLAAIGRDGGTGLFTGRDNTDAKGSRSGPGLVVSGNLLSDAAVIDTIFEGFLGSNGDFAERLLAALKAGERAGGDSRGLKSAALLIVGPDIAPLTLRIDCSDRPLPDLEALHRATQEPGYAAWMKTVPVPSDRMRR